jgi:hypothetical protein
MTWSRPLAFKAESYALSKAGWSWQFSAIPCALAGNGRARVNKPFRIDNLSVFLSFVHQAALMIWNERRKRELALLDDSGSNLFRDLLPILRRQCQLGFDRVGEKTAFNQNSRQPAIAKHVKFGRPDSAVLSANTRDDLPLNPLGEHGACAPERRPKWQHIGN